MGAGVRQFLRYLEEERACSENTLAAYQADLVQFEGVVGWAGPLDTATRFEPSKLRLYVQWLHQQGYRETTVGRKIAAVRSFIKYACRQSDIAFSLFLEVLDIPRTELSAPETLSPSALNRLLHPMGADPRALRDYAILYLMAETGLRPSQIADLEVDDVDWQNARLNLPPTSVDLHNSFAAIQAYVREGRPHLARKDGVGPLFMNRRGSAISRQGLWMIVKRRAIEAGLEGNITPQLLRHTFARHLLERGNSFRDVQERMRLSSAHILRIYHKDVVR
ncbi:MAG: tyrosine-type recombinase/integrase [Anaerolineales bacterium]|nr:tyrosine-type recombinase/integrase [Anaerolineales bacterium]